jgi:hypothetical protein
VRRGRGKRAVVHRQSREARRGDRVPGLLAGVVFAVLGQLIPAVDVFRGVVTSLTGSGHMKLPGAKNQCRLQVYTEKER